MILRSLFLLTVSLSSSVSAFSWQPAWSSSSSTTTTACCNYRRIQRPAFAVYASADDQTSQETTITEALAVPTRRKVLSVSAVAVLFTSSLLLPLPTRPCTAVASSMSSSSSASAQVTDKIYFTVNGLPQQQQGATTTDTTNNNRIVIGLFGQDAPKCVAQVKQLVGKQGLARPCRPRAVRSLQKEQLEANKIYSACQQAQAQGVVLQGSTIWRIVKDEQIAVGAVAGKYLAREYPDWNEDGNNGLSLRHDMPGVVSVLRGSEGGFGFSIYPGNGSSSNNTDQLDRDYIVIGRVLQGLDIVMQLNQVPVITTARGVNYMALSGTTATGKAPTRSCRYGGPMYCNEYKPLIKLSLGETGVL